MSILYLYIYIKYKYLYILKNNFEKIFKEVEYLLNIKFKLLIIRIIFKYFVKDLKPNQKWGIKKKFKYSCRNSSTSGPQE